MIDTSVFVEHLRIKIKSESALAKLSRAPHYLLTTTLVAAELFYGARTEVHRLDATEVLSKVELIPYGIDAASRIAFEVRSLVKGNALIGFRDLAIACVALELGLPIATLNRREFERVEGLELIGLGSLL